MLVAVVAQPAGSAAVAPGEWTPRQATVGFEFGYEKEVGYSQYELAPKLAWSPLRAAGWNSRVGYETEVYASDQRTVLGAVSGRSRTVGWSFLKLKVLDLAGLSFESRHTVPYFSAGIERAAVREGTETTTTTALALGVGFDIELNGGFGFSVGYREARPNDEPRRVEATAGLTYGFAKESATVDSDE